MGLNRFVIHTSVHQPLMDKGPGLSLGPFGQWFTRNETWAEQAKPWVNYLARSSFMLQQGRFVADIAYFYGEDYERHGALPATRRRAIPDGYNFDYVNADALMNRFSVSGRPARDAERHAVSRAGARPEQPAHVAAGAAQDSRRS